MKPKNRVTVEKKIYFRPEFKHCPHCQTKLKRSHTAWKKDVSTLDGVIQVWSMAYACPNETCPHPKAYYKSSEAEQICMKQSGYGFDVLCLIGELRYKDHRTISEIGLELNARGVVTSVRNVQNLYERYLTLLQASLDQHLQQTMQQVVESNGGLLLSMDGVQPERGNECLYVLREVNSGTVLAAKNLKSGSAAELKKLIQPILDFNFPIIGIISDGQQSIRLAFEELLPNVPYQYCQYHFLRNISLPLVDIDRKLKTKLKRGMRGVWHQERRIEKLEEQVRTATAFEQTQAVTKPEQKQVATAPEQTPDDEIAAADSPSETTTAEIQAAKKYIQAVRSLLQEDGQPPLDLPGIRIYQGMQKIQVSLQKCMDKKGGQTPGGYRQNISKY